ncbi:MAG: hypothetical protein QXW97_02675 [Candidatus Pacearchaeota archaeon]
MVIFLILIILFVSTLYLVTKANNVDMTTLSGFGNGMKIYGIWILNQFSGIKSITGNAVNLDWAKVNLKDTKPISNNITSNNNQANIEAKTNISNSTKNLMKPKPLK